MVNAKKQHQELTNTIQLRVSATQKEQFQKAAQAEGLAVSAWLRRIALNEAKNPK
jgi:uncharacterized protein (DUF1778 family)